MILLPALVTAVTFGWWIAAVAEVYSYGRPQPLDRWQMASSLGVVILANAVAWGLWALV